MWYSAHIRNYKNTSHWACVLVTAKSLFFHVHWIKFPWGYFSLPYFPTCGALAELTQMRKAGIKQELQHVWLPHNSFAVSNFPPVFRHHYCFFLHAYSRVPGCLMGLCLKWKELCKHSGELQHAGCCTQATVYTNAAVWWLQTQNLMKTLNAFDSFGGFP